MVPPHILMIDDDYDLLDLLGTYLKQKGYQISIAADGFEGLEKAWEFQPDLIFLDLILPNLNGQQVYRILRMRDITQYTPVIILTAKAIEGVPLEGFQEGVDCYVSKPHDRNHLIELIESRVMKPMQVKVSEGKTA